MTDTCNLYII